MSTDTTEGQASFRPDAIQRAHANHIDAFRALAQVLPSSRTEEDSGAVFVRSGLPSAEFNAVYVTDPPKDPSRFGTRVRRFFEGWTGPWQILATPVAANTVRSVAENLHLTPVEGVPLMLLDPLDVPPLPLPTGVSLVQVEDPQTLRTYFLTGARGNGAPEEAFEPVAGDPEVLSRVLADRHWANYLAYLDGAPVATTLRYTTHGVAGIYFVSTVPEFRRRGIGGAITLQVARDGLEEGCMISALQATPMGFPVYQRLGYRTAYRYAQWATGGTEGPA